MQGVLAATKLHGAASVGSRAAAVTSSRASGFVLGGKQPGKQVAPRTIQQHARAVEASAAAVAAEPAAPLPVALPPPSRKVRKSINDAHYQFKFIVPDALVGAFLGKGGSHVNRVKEETGVYVQFTKPGTAVNAEKDRMLILASDTVDQAKQAISLLIKGVAQVEGALGKLRTPQSGDRLFMQLVIPAMCAGNIMGPAGEVIKGIGARTASTLLVEPKLANAAFIPFRLVNFSCPGEPALSAALGEVMDRLAQDEKYADGIREVASVCIRLVKVPDARAGAILGPGGSHIKTLQEMLKVKIGVGEPTGNAGGRMRYVTLWGPPMNVKVAIDVILLTTGQLQTEAERREAAGQRQRLPYTPRSSTSAAPSQFDDASSVAGSSVAEGSSLGNGAQQ